MPGVVARRILRTRLATVVAALVLLMGVRGTSHAAESAALDISAAPEVAHQGDAVLLRIDCRCEAVSGAAGTRLAGHPLVLFRSNGSTAWRALIGIDLDVRPGSYPVTITLNLAAGPPLTAIHMLRVTAREFPTRRLRVAPGFVDPPADIQQRIVDEAAQLRKVYASVTAGGAGRMQAPAPTAVTSNFGARSVFNGQPRSPHAGVDFAGPAGTPVVAPGPATVALAGDLYFTGRTVVLDHGQGLHSILAHLSDITVSEGSRVERGAVVGALGATGRVTGPHLHWSVRLHGARVDPLSVLKILADE